MRAPWRRRATGSGAGGAVRAGSRVVASGARMISDGPRPQRDRERARYPCADAVQTLVSTLIL